MYWEKCGEKYILRLELDEPVHKSLEKFADQVEIGYFNTRNKEYEKEKLKGDLELLSLMGNLTRPEGSPVSHLHVVLSGPDHRAIGGHLLYGEVAITVELLIQVFEAEIDREKNSELGFFPMSLRHHLRIE